MQNEDATHAGLTVSIVICTDGRAEALANTLRCLQYLDGPDFEVVVVRGPTEDGTADVLAEWSGRIKVGFNPERNLSVSRNIGIGLASGEIIAFIDDDGLPEPEWLPQIITAFDDPNVAGAGGIVMDHTGARPQYLYASADRLGNADLSRTSPADSYNFPLSFHFPYVQGTNSAFRRDALLAIGGFDEEYEFYLDETDICCRLIDAGWTIRQLADAVVHHKFLPSAIRTADRVTRVLYPVLKNKLYFSLINNCGHYPIQRAVEDMMAFVQMQEAGLRHHVEAGRLPASDLEAYRMDVDRAWNVGLQRGLSGPRRLMQSTHKGDEAPPFLIFPRTVSENGRQVYVFCSQEYPPDRMGGIGRYIHQLARSLAGLGHHVHVLTAGEDYDRVDFEDNVWVHRLILRPSLPQPPDLRVPDRIWARASTLLQAVQELAGRHKVAVVYAPIWDCEGLAILGDRTFSFIVGLQTTLRFWLDSHPHWRSDADFMATFAEPMLACERQLLQHATGVHAISGSIANEIEAAYDVTFENSRLAIVPLGLEDWTAMPAVEPAPLPPSSLRLLFVGRLESRKGVDVLFDAAKRVLARHPHVHLDMVGNDRIPGPGGVTYRDAFTADAGTEAIRARVVFHGEVSEERLRGFYRACDILVTPSRFESFGLMLVEGMMFGKPVIGCRAGGMVEVVEDGISGLLAEPGDAASLEACLERLIGDTPLRTALGRAARARYQAKFTADRMARAVASFMSDLHRTSHAVKPGVAA